MNEELKKVLASYNSKAKILKQGYKITNDKFGYYKALNDYECFKDVLTENEFKRVLKYKRNRASRRYRANNKINKMLFMKEPIIIFGTCTFNDSQFFKKNGKPISEERRTRKINSWIKEHFRYAVVNIDYGTKNEREHHHFVGVLKENEKLENKKSRSKKGHTMYELENKTYTLGFEPTLEIVKYDPTDFKMKRLSNYLLKITNHENKATTKSRRFRIIGDWKE